MCYCTPSIRTISCGKADCIPQLAVRPVDCLLCGNQMFYRSHPQHEKEVIITAGKVEHFAHHECIHKAIENRKIVGKFSTAAIDVTNERRRQIEVEHRTPELDDTYKKPELAIAGGCYALYADSFPNQGEPPPEWPWSSSWWKPKNYRADLVRAAALLIAEIERYDRSL